jgi:hypothetical protein
MSAARRSRFWFDPRFAIGIALILVSVGGTALVVTAADNTVDVLVARDALTPGAPVARDGVVVRKVAVDDATGVYLSPDDLDDALLLTRVVGAGEIIPRSAVARESDSGRTSVVVAVDGQLSSAVHPGASVEVWASSVAESGDDGPPAVIASDAVVTRIASDDELVVADSDRSVELLVPRDDVAVILESLARDAAIAVVPAALPAGE